MNSGASNLRAMLHQRKSTMLQHIFVLLAKLLICGNLIANAAGTTYTATNVTATATTDTSMLATTSQHSNMPHNWLRRQRRYLLFEKGSAVVLQTSCSKAIIPERPRGLYTVYEYAVNYVLPASMDDLWPKPRKAHPTTMTKTKQVAMTKLNTTAQAAAAHRSTLINFRGSESKSNYNAEEIWLPPRHATADWPAAEAAMPSRWQVPAQRRQWFSAHKQQQRQKYGKQQQQYGKQYNIREQQHRFPAPSPQANSFTFTPSLLSGKYSKLPVAAHPRAHQPAVCPRRNVYGSWQHNVPRLCAVDPKAFGRGRRQRSDGVGVAGGVKYNDDAGHRIDERADGFHFATNAERVLFDLLAQWAHIYNYPPQHCIMRTFCESRHLLAPRGQSLFHDLLRILIDAALPAARRHATYKKAISHDNLSDCAQHYATLCGLSFLQHFNEIAHGRFMR